MAPFSIGNIGTIFGRRQHESSMLELKTMNDPIEPTEEANILPELIAA
ncbi:hypothetical protein [Subtercola boreus]|nr:hypothetical protein [Subtercola boreus]